MDIIFVTPRHHEVVLTRLSEHIFFYESLGACSLYRDPQIGCQIPYFRDHFVQKWKLNILIFQTALRIQVFWRPSLGVNFYVESVLEVQKCQILHPDENIKENAFVKRTHLRKAIMSTSEGSGKPAETRSGGNGSYRSPAAFRTIQDLEILGKINNHRITHVWTCWTQILSSMSSMLKGSVGSDFDQMLTRMLPDIDQVAGQMLANCFARCWLDVWQLVWDLWKLAHTYQTRSTFI